MSMVLKKFDPQNSTAVDVVRLKTLHLGLGVDLNDVRAAICKDLAVSAVEVNLVAMVEPFGKPPVDTIASFLVSTADNEKVDLDWAYIVVFE